MLKLQQIEFFGKNAHYHITIIYGMLVSNRTVWLRTTKKARWHITPGLVHKTWYEVAAKGMVNQTT